MLIIRGEQWCSIIPFGKLVEPEPTQDNILPHLKEKTLIIKDGDTLIEEDSLSILAELRQLYDSSKRVSEDK